VTSNFIASALLDYGINTASRWIFFPQCANNAKQVTNTKDPAIIQLCYQDIETKGQFPSKTPIPIIHLFPLLWCSDQLIIHQKSSARNQPTQSNRANELSEVAGFPFPNKKHTTTDSHAYPTPTNIFTPTNRLAFRHNDPCNDDHHPSLQRHRKYQEPHTQRVQRGRNWKVPCANCKRIHRAGNRLAKFKVQYCINLHPTTQANYVPKPFPKPSCTLFWLSWTK